ncbi:type VI secretion system protein VasG [Malaciobacter marinus]|jgi:type VI secretion system protein VasG|uniref:Chaperone protein ClpB n=1 Tax=Malaciobacter marinus TaxID=505249 RepID=A0AB36ZWE0_9BACT|nr:type VI secretion system ATPase TssH [Malaciobacter marinus]PPK61317.1 type VI secretion system protein VasG [Malaciobacter marinus]SKB66398.1 type VI secretion system protein VasG [Malaciobacter marinus]
MKLELKNLINNLDRKTKKHLENSAQRCIVRGGSEILIEDILYVFLEDENSIFSLMLNQYKIDKNELIKVIQKEVKISISESNSPIFSTILVNWLEDSYSYAKLILNQNEITQSSMILSLFENSIKYSNTKYFKIFEKIDIKELKELIEGLNEQAIENKSSNENSNTKSEIEKYTTDLTQLAKDNKIDPVLCRDDEIKQAIDILLRRRKNNPILVGEAGVGKTAVVEGLALKIVNNEVPIQLKEAKILSLDVGALQAGASVKGEFERRLQEVINKLKASSEFVILFIDEAHTLIGAGGNEGSSDAANLLKPALARGELKTIAATTWLEYRKYFEKDPALSRRFQKINLLEPTVSEATTILRGIAKKYEEAHDVYIEDDAIKSASSLSARYITSRQLPDKAIDVLDTACANVKISQSNIPFELQKITTKILEKQREIEFLQRDDINKIKNNKDKIKILKDELKTYENEEKEIRRSWEEQKEVLDKIIKCKDKKEKSKLKTQLKNLQKKNMYIFNTVNKEQVAKVISSWTGIPLGNMVEEQVRTVVELENRIKDKVIGQEEAISYLNRFLQISVSGLKKEDSPTGVFLLVGPSGVGKTETAKAIAQFMYGGEKFITTINMTEFQEKHTISRLIGSPPGYVGYGDGGQLTDPVRVKPYSVILLDEIEKAHPDILNLFYQIFDKGEVNDGEGRVIDFKNTTIIMTSNLATKEITSYCQNNKDNISFEELSSLITPVLSDYLKPALLGRMNVIPYFNLNEEALIKITKQKFEITKKQLLKKEIVLEIDEKLIKYIVSLSNSIDTGARNIDLIINTKIMPKLSKYLLDSSINKKKIKNISLNLDSKSNEIVIK